jgi:hypothetical protein
MLGFNGGLMGARRTPTTSGATGLWFQNEQSVAKRAAIWPTTLPSNPIPALSPILWYDFADEATVTTSGTQITQITDKGSRNWTLTKSSTGPEYVTGINSKKCVDWGSSSHGNYLRNTSTTSTDVAEMYIVLDAAFDSTFPDYNGLVSGSSGSIALAGNSGGAGFWGGSAWDDAFVNGSATDTFASVLPSINSASLLRIKKADNTAAALANGFQIGQDRDNGPGRGWFGLIGEVVCFSSVLGSTDRGSVQDFLAAKWSITLV